MQKKLSLALAAAVLVSLSACSMFSKKTDTAETSSVAKLYAEARESMDAGQYANALKSFEKLETNYPFGNYGTQAQMEIAYAHYKLQDQAEAMAAVERFIKLHPNHPALDYIYYLRGLINFNDSIGFLSVIYEQDPTERDPKATRESFAAFKALVDKFPNSQYTPDAIARMNYLVNAMAQYEVHVANYYFRRGAHLAALNRAMEAVKDYQNAPAREEALYLMVRSYHEMGMTELRDDTKRVFETNYPNSRYLKANSGRPSWWKFWAKSAN